MSASKMNEFKQRHLAFWRLEPVDRPLIGFTIGAGMDSWSYWQYNKAAQVLFTKGSVNPEDIDPASFVEDQRRYLEVSQQVEDDVCRTAMPLASIPWMEAILGCPVVSTESHLGSQPILANAGDLTPAPFDPGNPWVQKYLEFIEIYREAFVDRYPVAQSVLRGPSDLACALLGAEQATLALTLEPEAMKRLLGYVTDQEEQFLRLQLGHLPPFRDGHVIGQYEIWAPGTTLRMQEDFSTLYSPTLYSEFLKPLDERLAAIAHYTLIHLHASSLFLIDRFLEIQAIKVFQVTKDAGARSLSDMMPGLQKIQTAVRPLIVKGRFDEADIELMKRHLRTAGLCIQPVVGSITEAKEMLPKLRDW